MQSRSYSRRTPRSQCWKRRLGGEVFSSPALTGAGVAVGADDDRLRLLDAATGEVRWSVQLGDCPRASGFGPAAGPELLEVWTRDNTFPAARIEPPRFNLRSVGAVLEGYVREARGAQSGTPAHELIRGALELVDPTAARYETLDRYPFLKIEGRSALEIVEDAIALRMRSLVSASSPSDESGLLKP